MKNKGLLFTFTLFLLIILLNYSFASIRPSFDEHYCSQNATHIVLVTEIDTTKGIFQVLETWKGHLQPGETITIPELISFASESSRIITHHWPNYNKQTTEYNPKYVTGQKMVLFLTKSSTFTPIKNEKETNVTYKENVTWFPASWYKNKMWVSVAWIEQDGTYAFRQVMNPGPSLLVPLYLSEKQFKEKVLHYVEEGYASNTSEVKHD